MIHAVVEMCPSLIHFSFTCDPTRNDLNAIKQLSQLPDLYSLSIGLTRKLRSTNMPVMLSSLSAVIEKGALKVSFFRKLFVINW